MFDDVTGDETRSETRGDGGSNAKLLLRLSNAAPVPVSLGDDSLATSCEGGASPNNVVTIGVLQVVVIRPGSALVWFEV